MRNTGIGIVGISLASNSASADTEFINPNEGDDIGEFMEIREGIISLNEEVLVGLRNDSVRDYFDEQEFEIDVISSGVNIQDNNFSTSDVGNKNSVLDGEQPHGLGEFDGWTMDGSGTASDPYIIYDEWDLQAIKSYPDSHFELANNINCDNYSDWNDWVTTGQTGFSPILNFTGVLDGQGYSINNFYTFDDGASGVSMIASMDSAIIKDIKIGVNGVIGGDNIGVFRNVDNSDIDNVYIDYGNITSDNSASPLGDITNSTVNMRVDGVSISGDTIHTFAKDIDNSDVRAVVDLLNYNDSMLLYNSDTSSDLEIYTRNNYSEDSILLSSLSSDVIEVINDTTNPIINAEWEIIGNVEVNGEDVQNTWFNLGSGETTTFTITDILSSSFWESGSDGDYILKVDILYRGSSTATSELNANVQEETGTGGGANPDESESDIGLLEVLAGTTIGAFVLSLLLSRGGNNNHNTNKRGGRR